MTPASDLELVQAVYQAINRDDMVALRRLLAPGVVVATTVEGFQGHAGAEGWLRQVRETFEGFSMDVEEIFERAGEVVVVTRQRGRGRGSGIEIEHRITHVWELHDGRAVRMRAFPGRMEPGAGR